MATKELLVTPATNWDAALILLIWRATTDSMVSLRFSYVWRPLINVFKTLFKETNVCFAFIKSLHWFVFASCSLLSGRTLCVLSKHYSDWPACRSKKPRSQGSAPVRPCTHHARHRCLQDSGHGLWRRNKGDSSYQESESNIGNELTHFFWF